MSNKTDEVLIPEIRKVVIGSEEFEIGPLVRAKYKKLIDVFAELAVTIDLEKLDDIQKDPEAMKYILNIVSDDALMELYAVTLEKRKKWIDNNILLHQEIELLTKIVEVNDVEKIVENFLLAVKKKQLINQVQTAFQNSKL